MEWNCKICDNRQFVWPFSIEQETFLFHLSHTYQKKEFTKNKK